MNKKNLVFLLSLSFMLGACVTPNGTGDVKTIQATDSTMQPNDPITPPSTSESAPTPPANEEQNTGTPDVSAGAEVESKPEEVVPPKDEVVSIPMTPLTPAIPVLTTSQKLQQSFKSQTNTMEEAKAIVNERTKVFFESNVLSVNKPVNAATAVTSAHPTGFRPIDTVAQSFKKGWNQGYEGKGVKVGVIDTGIDQRYLTGDTKLKEFGNAQVENVTYNYNFVDKTNQEHTKLEIGQNGSTINTSTDAIKNNKQTQDITDEEKKIIYGVFHH